ncbi:MAG: pilus assembly protein PilM [Candidatus Hydrogenedentes bacterium]|nr:pilus assembly protein PilM [Candidatus Hydrogenedentota bacterium]
MGIFGREIVSVISIDKESVTLITVKVKKNRFELLQLLKEKVSPEPLTDEEGNIASQEETKRERLAEAFNVVFSKIKYKPSFFVLAVPSEYSIVRTLSIPFRGAKKVNSVLKFELEPHIPFPIEELKLDYFVIDEGKKETEILVLGVRDMYVSEHISVLEEFSTKPESAVIDSLGLAYLWSKLDRNQQRIRAGLFVDKNFALFAIVKGVNLVFVRHLFMGRDLFHSNPEVFSREIQNSVRAFLAKWKGEDKIEAMDLWGVELSESELEIFSKMVKLEVRNISFSELVSNRCKEVTSEEVINLSRFIGIAGLVTDPKFSFNLLKGNETLYEYLPVISRHFIFANSLILTGLVMSAFFLKQLTLANLVQAKLCESETEQITQEIERINAEKGLDENVELGVFFLPPFLEILAKIGEIFPSDKVDITEIRVAPPDNQGWWIRVQGKTRDSAFINQAIPKLKEVQYFDVTDEPELSAQGDLTSFAVKIQRKNSSLSTLVGENKIEVSNKSSQLGD